MSLCTNITLLRTGRTYISYFNSLYSIRNYAKKDTGAVSMLGGMLKKKKGIGKLGGVSEKRVLPVETDPQKLVTHCCGANFLKTGEEIKLKPDTEYPDWLWQIRLGPPPTLEELEPNSREYWKKVRHLAIKRNLQLARLKKF